MYDYIIGKISLISPNYITIECNNIGYKVFTPNSYEYKEEEINKIYLYSHIREDEYSLYGFKSIEVRDMFLKLINVKGLGPKMALPILSTGSLDGIKDAIEKENILYLTKFPKIGEKLARQTILDLKGKLSTTEATINNNDELVSALSGLGYKQNDIKKVLKEIDYNKTIEVQLKDALKLLLK